MGYRNTPEKDQAKRHPKSSQRFVYRVYGSLICSEKTFLDWLILRIPIFSPMLHIICVESLSRS